MLERDGDGWIVDFVREQAKRADVVDDGIDAGNDVSNI
jgi:hypothetical protein